MGLLVHLFRHLRVGDLGAQLLNFSAVAAVVFAQLFLNGLHLLAQHKLAFALPHAGLGALVNFARDLHYLNAVHHHRQQAVHALAQVHLFQQFLLLGGLDVQVARHDVGQGAWHLHALNTLRQLGRHLGQQAQDFHRPLPEPQKERLGFAVQRGGGVFNHLDLGHHEVKALHVTLHPKTLLPLADDVVGTVGRAHVAQDGRHRAHGRQIGTAGRFHFRVALHQDAHRALGFDRVLRRRNRARSPNGDGHDGAGEQHHVAHRHDHHGVFRNRRQGGLAGVKLNNGFSHVCLPMGLPSAFACGWSS